MERVPIGVENYLDAISSYYIDKTMLIKEVIDFFPFRTVFITRPRRFGKSLTLSMLEYFFTNKGDYSFVIPAIIYQEKWEMGKPGKAKERLVKTWMSCLGMAKKIGDYLNGKGIPF